MLDPSAKEPPVTVYDSSGVYTDGNAGIDVERGLKRTRVEWVRERGGVEEYQGRPIQPVDNEIGHTSELQSRQYLVCRLLLEKKKKKTKMHTTKRHAQMA